MKNFKVRTRLLLGFSSILILMMVVGFGGITGMSRIEAGMKQIVNENVYKSDLLNTMSESVHVVSRVTRTIVILRDINEMKAEKVKIDEARNNYDRSWQALEKTTADEKGKILRTRIQEARNAARVVNDKIIEAGLQNKDEEATTALKASIPVNKKWQDMIHENIELQKEKTKQSVEEAHAAYQFSRNLLIGLMIFAAIAGCVIALYISNSITQPLNEAVKIADTVASGDLTARIEVQSQDETGKLMQSLRNMNDSLKEIVGQVRGSGETLATAASEIAAGNQDLSSRTEQQASSLEETASSMEELTSTVRQNGNNAQQANNLAVSASNVAIKGGAIVSEVVKTMGVINESSKKMVEIINVIDGIAFQTNILALNAAVEAARAGEQGRGFAVVATEVRSLAQRSASAAREIKTLIDDSVDKIESGSKLVNNAGETMTEIVGSIRSVTDIMGEIAAATREQVDGIEQVNQAVSQMDQVTQQNAALVEEAAAAAESMQNQTNALVQLVSVFKIGHAATVTASISKQVPIPVVAPRTTTVTKTKVLSLEKPSGNGSENWEQF